jgi:hypothetical protein
MRGGLKMARFASERPLFPNADLYIAPVAGGPAHRLTSDGHSLYPVWGALKRGAYEPDWSR